MNNSLKLISLLSGALVLMSSGCTGGGGSSASGGSEAGETAPIKPQAEPRVVFDSIAQIPLGAKDSTVLIRIHNDFASPLVLKSVKVINPSTNKEDSKLATVNGNGCSLVPATNNCSISITSHLKKSGSFILEAELSGENSKNHKLRQLIRVSDRIKTNNGIAFENDFTRLASADGRYSLAFPVLLSEHFDKVAGSNGNIVCNGGYNPGSLCTYFIDGKVKHDNTLIDVSVTGYKGETAVASNKSSILYTTVADEAHLLISQPADIKIAKGSKEGTADITLFNSGLAAATGTSIQVNDVNNALTPVSGCKDQLEIGETCTFTIKALSEKSGAGVVTVNYLPKTSGTKLTSAVNAYYIKEEDETLLELIAFSGDLTNTFINQTKTQEIKVHNKGGTTIYGLKYNLSGGADLSVAGANLDTGIPPCSSTEVLKTGADCGLKVTYTPTAETAEKLYNLYVHGSYTSTSGETLTLLTQFSDKYSAIDAATIKPLVELDKYKLSLTATDGEKKEEVVTVTNKSPQAVKLGTIELAPTDVQLTIENGANQCAAGGELANGGACSVTVKYTGVTGHTKDAKLQINLQEYGGANNTSQYTAAVEAKTVAAYKEANVTVSGPNVISTPEIYGKPATNTYEITAFKGSKTLQLEYTFNFSDADLFGFSISPAGLPAGAHLVASTDNDYCPIGTAVKNYAAGQSCKVIVEAPKSNLIDSKILSGTQTLDIAVLYSWQDFNETSGNKQLRRETTSLQKVNVTTDWLGSAFNISASPSFTADSDPAAIIRAEFATITLGGSNFSYPLVVKVRAIDGSANDKTCDILDKDQRACQIEVKLPQGAPDGEYHYKVEVSDYSTPQRTHEETVMISKN